MVGGSWHGDVGYRAWTPASQYNVIERAD
jgi:hypothetical protein